MNMRYFILVVCLLFNSILYAQDGKKELIEQVLLRYTDEDGEIFATIFGLIGGFFRGVSRVFRGEKFTDIFTYTWKGMANGAKIDWGMFKGSPNQIMSRFIKEPLQTTAGYFWSTYRNTNGWNRLIINSFHPTLSRLPIAG